MREEQTGSLTSQSSGPGIRAAGSPTADRMALAMHDQLYVYFPKGEEHDDPNSRSGDR